VRDGGPVLSRRRRAQHHAQIVRGAIVDDGVERLEDLRARDFGEKAERSEIHRKDWHIAAALGDRLGHR
jgi:hypothetical protein